MKQCDGMLVGDAIGTVSYTVGYRKYLTYYLYWCTMLHCAPTSRFAHVQYGCAFVLHVAHYFPADSPLHITLQLHSASHLL